MLASRTFYWPALGLAFVVFIIDQLSKFWIQGHLPLMQYFHSFPYGGIPIFQHVLGVDFAIVHAINKGAAWSLFSSYQIALVWLRIAMVAGLVLYLFFGTHTRNQLFPLTLIIAGALGNIFDYFIYGHVIDMLFFVLWGYDYPVFNIADSAIFMGVFWLLLSSFCKKSSEEKAT